VVEVKAPVTLSGFIVSSSLPSTALLDVTFKRMYENVPIGREIIALVRGYFYNKLKTLRRKYYTQILPKYSIKAGFGYIIPTELAPDFLEEIKELREEYEQYERDLRNFIQHGVAPATLRRSAKVDPKYLEVVRKYLEKKGVPEIRVPKIAERVSVQLIPVALGLDVVERIADEETREVLKKEIEKLKKEIMDSTLRQVKERLAELQLELGKKRLRKADISRIKQELSNLGEMVKSVGVDAREIYNLLDTIKEIEEGKTKVDLSKLSGRAKALAETLLEYSE